MSHTKGELKIMPYTRRDGDNIRWIKDSRNKAICQTFKPRAEANARRLVKCWNSHDALLDACRQGLSLLKEHPDYPGFKDCSCGHCTVCQIEAAIAQCK
ncbi:hypothetical protein LCGC14_3008650 [marine sediment metagenome]|uniref:Uncharacterized protein n=1 Tax=marine sediment metagenome TaxID=412755 RepID=A0A0F8XLN0_9ZZZZ